ncbi:hypothetical protein Bhyg_06542 [Pseudolycoriella hygida]|uniref:Uncharacterized protein n=1 Tax=Pseudolycoriella hygida TaxID=35572 RepID=A0A9Q0N0V1_9DIPT|nr:hypothetical protein Bhyg_06542 [Pseudolycoriella hygida]
MQIKDRMDDMSLKWKLIKVRRDKQHTSPATVFESAVRLHKLLKMLTGEFGEISLLGPVTPYAGYSTSAAAMPFRCNVYQPIPNAISPTRSLKIDSKI